MMAWWTRWLAACTRMEWHCLVPAKLVAPLLRRGPPCALCCPHRARSVAQVMRRDCTYTFAYFSSNVDLHLWRIVRLPGGQSYDLHSIIKDAGILDK